MSGVGRRMPRFILSLYEIGLLLLGLSRYTLPHGWVIKLDSFPIILAARRRVLLVLCLASALVALLALAWLPHLARRLYVTHVGDALVDEAAYVKIDY